jgi:hypothetical protein
MKSHSALLVEDRMEEVVSLNIMSNSVEPLSVVIMVLQLGPQHSRQPAQILSTSSSCSSSSTSNTSSSSASESALQAVPLDTLDRWTTQVLAAHQAAHQECRDKSTFPAQLAEAL